MEIPVINRLTDFEGGINSLHTSSLSLSAIDRFSQAYTFCKWGAFILAVVASFGTIIKRIRVLVLRLRRHRSLSSQPLVQNLDDDDFSDSDDDADDDSSSTASSSDYGEDGSRDGELAEEDFRVAGPQNGCLRLRRRRSIGNLWSEFTAGRSVVKLWDNLGLASPGGGFSAHVLNADGKVSSFLGGNRHFPVISASSPAVVLSSAAGKDLRDRALRVWDTRVGCRIPAMLAEWRPQIGKIMGVYSAGGGEKVYVGDSFASGLAVGDMRKLRSPLDNVTKPDMEAWWDADNDDVFVRHPDRL